MDSLPSGWMRFTFKESSRDQAHKLFDFYVLIMVFFDLTEPGEWQVKVSVDCLHVFMFHPETIKLVMFEQAYGMRILEDVEQGRIETAARDYFRWLGTK